MTSRSPVPPALSPYIRIPPSQSLILCTSVLGALNNWVLLRYLYSCLGSSTAGRHGLDGDAGGVQDSRDDTTVIFVSWMRDLAFWKTEARRSVGLDLAKLQQQGRLVFVDGLTKLFDGDGGARGTSPAIPNAAARPSTPPPIGALQQPHEQTGHSYLTDPSLPTLESTVSKAFRAVPQTARAVLILDTPTLPLSLSRDPTHELSDFSRTMMHLRSHPHVHATIVSIPVDDPLVSAAQSQPQVQHTPLEIANAAVTAQLVSQAGIVLGTRRLGTGWAKDVSGVVRVTRGGMAAVDGEGDEDGGKDAAQEGGIKEGEWLYHVAGDGSVRVWSRGSGEG